MGLNSSNTDALGSNDLQSQCITETQKSTFHANSTFNIKLSAKNPATFGCLGDNIKGDGVCVCVHLALKTCETPLIFLFFFSWAFMNRRSWDCASSSHWFMSLQCASPQAAAQHSTAEHSHHQSCCYCCCCCTTGGRQLLLTSPRTLLSSPLLSCAGHHQPALSARFDGRTCCLCGSEEEEEEEEETGGRRWWLVLVVVLVLVEVGLEGGVAGGGDLRATVWSSRGGASC